ncbi:hypothetical protein F4809DRAFT_442245 [Biscogniauxia mediterranea]|nr:hypothetical protein F4809DRAFT_442245 [Biscogniauxia mediterranea]
MPSLTLTLVLHTFSASRHHCMHWICTIGYEPLWRIALPLSRMQVYMDIVHKYILLVGLATHGAGKSITRALMYGQQSIPSSALRTFISTKPPAQGVIVVIVLVVNRGLSCCHRTNRYQHHTYIHTLHIVVVLLYYRYRVMPLGTSYMFDQNV